MERPDLTGEGEHVGDHRLTREQGASDSQLTLVAFLAWTAGVSTSMIRAPKR